MSWFDWVPSLLNDASSIYGNIVKTGANNQAAQVSTAAQQTATADELQGLNAAKGNYGASVANDQSMQNQSAPGVAQQQQEIAQQNVLTPAQQLALTNAQRQSINDLNASGLAGSGRAATASANYVGNELTTGALAQNRNRADTAASALSGQYFNAGQNINTQNSNIANANVRAGQVAGAGALGVGAIGSGNIIGNAGVDASTAQSVAGGTTTPLAGQAIGDINSQVNAYNKSRSTYTGTGSNVAGGGQPISPQTTTLGGMQ